MLSDRQVELLSAIIKEYTASAEPVGSVGLVEKYNFKCSPATVRNEMAKLISLGYLEMFHTSSGRIPTKDAYKFFLEEVLIETELPVLQEVAMKQRLWPNRYDVMKLLRESVLSLSEITKELAIAITDDGFITYAGTVNVLDNKEFWEIQVAKTALTLLDNVDILEKIFGKVLSPDEIKFLIGNDIEIENLERCAFVFSNYQVGDKKGRIAVFGPARMKYDEVVPAIKYTKRLIEELAESW